MRLRWVLKLETIRSYLSVMRRKKHRPVAEAVVFKEMLVSIVIVNNFV
jgi:hypothetical protein